MPGLLVQQAPPPPAPKVIGPTTKNVTRPTNPLPQYLIDDAAMTKPQAFDAEKHIVFQDPANILTMEDIGLKGHGISPHAVTDPFPLFSQEAIAQIRREVFSEPVVRDCQFSSTFNKNMIRGMGPERAPFTYAAWNSPALLAAVSKVAGIDLVPSMDFEVANINISVNNNSNSSSSYSSPEEKKGKKEDMNSPLSSVAWHYDSFPFVCVVMLSDCSSMVGGETAVRIPPPPPSPSSSSSCEPQHQQQEKIIKVRGPAMGTAVVMQGRYIEHQALKALGGGKERISMVTCFRAKDPEVRDETVLTGVRGISNKEEMYGQYLDYRLGMLRERAEGFRVRRRRRQQQQNKNKDKNQEGEGEGAFDREEVVRWLREQMGFLGDMVKEIGEEEEEDDEEK